MSIETFRRRRLPHWEQPHATYFITACLAGSIPATGLLAIRQSLQRSASRPPCDPQRLQRWRRGKDRLAFLRQEEWLDAGVGARWFADPRLASVASDAIHYHAGKRYALYAYVVMPSHIHCVLSPIQAAERSGPISRFSSVGTVMHALKSFIAHECTKMLGLNGPFWQQESYDRLVRNESELGRVVAYTEWNPVKANLCARPEDWRFSSASGRLPHRG